MDPTPAAEAIHPLLPGLAPWLPVLLWTGGGALAGALSAWVGLRCAIAPLRRLAEDAHWTERARVAYPACLVSGQLMLYPTILLQAVAVQVTGPLSVPPPAVVGTLAAAAAYLSCFSVRRHFGRELGRGSGSFWRDFAGEWVGLVLMVPHLLLMLAMLVTLGSPLGTVGLLAVGGFAVAFALLLPASGVPVLRWLGAARPADARLEQIVREAARPLGVMPRAVWVVRWPVVNAVSLPFGRQVAFTERALETLDDDELAAISRHELGHLTEPAGVKLMRALTLPPLFALGLTRPIVGRFGLEGILLILTGWLLLSLIVTRVARRMEERADAEGHAHGSDDGVYARALEKAYQANLAPAVMPGKGSPHPHLYDRLVSAGVEPAYPRPAPPSQRRMLAGGLVSAMCLATLIVGLLSAPQWGPSLAPDPAGAARVRVSLSGGARGAYDLGVLRGRQGATSEGVSWLAFETGRNPGDHHAPAYAASLLSWAGRCAEADAWLAESERRAADAASRCTWIAQAREARQGCEPVQVGRSD